MPGMKRPAKYPVDRALPGSRLQALKELLAKSEEQPPERERKQEEAWNER